MNARFRFLFTISVEEREREEKTCWNPKRDRGTLIYMIDLKNCITSAKLKLIEAQAFSLIMLISECDIYLENFAKYTCLGLLYRAFKKGLIER